RRTVPGPGGDPGAGTRAVTTASARPSGRGHRWRTILGTSAVAIAGTRHGGGRPSKTRRDGETPDAAWSYGPGRAPRYGDGRDPGGCARDDAATLDLLPGRQPGAAGRLGDPRCPGRHAHHVRRARARRVVRAGARSKPERG